MFNFPLSCNTRKRLENLRLFYYGKSSIVNLVRYFNIGKEKDYYLNIYDSYYKNPKNYDYVKRSFQELSNLKEENGFSVLIVIFPIFYDFKNYQWSYAHNMVIEEAKNNGFYVIDLYEVYKDIDPDTIRNPSLFDFVHPNKKGHLIAAQAIAELIDKEEMVNSLT